MYVNYPDDSHEQAKDTAARAIEGDAYHLRIQRASSPVSFTITAGTTATQSITFAKPYTPNTTPNVYVTPASVGTMTSRVTWERTNVTNTGFTIQVNSDTAQTVTFDWIAIGDAE